MHSSASNTVFGGLNYPFASSPVASGDTNITLKSFIEASSNTVIIYSILDDREDVYGAYSVLSDAMKNSAFTLSLNTPITSIFSFCNNKVEISSYTTIDDIYGACLLISTNTTNSITFNSSIYLDNNSILFNSSATVDGFAYAAKLELKESQKVTYNLANVSLSSNTVEIKDTISDCDDLSAARLIFPATASSVENLYIINNKISFSSAASGIQLPDTTVHGVYIDNLDKVSVTNKYQNNNMLELNSAKNITLKSISGFDSFSFALPLDIRNYETLITLTSQPQEDNIQVDAHKLFISNYDHHTPTLTVNLIDASPGSGHIDLSNTNGSYLYDHTRTQLEVKNSKLIFTFDPTIAPSPVDPINPAPDSPLPTTLNPQTAVITGGASSNLAFLTQGLDLIIDKAIDSAKYLSVKSHSWAPFACADVAKSKFFIGHNSNLDVNGFSIIAGIAKNLPILDHNFTFAAFFEHGNSKFETSHHFDYDTDDFTVAGDGSAYYNGGGLLARFDLNNNIYFNASLRAGLASCNFKTVDLTKITHFSFDYSPTYYGANAGAGYLYPINKDFNLNFNANYFITNLAGKDTPLPENQSISFDTEHLQKVKIGLKFIRLLSDPSGHSASAFIGPAFEYQLHNDFNATISGQPV
ncbi:MAG: autotransporter outer membrane beta-barrel domain-containing protein, partial [Rickettsiales bacterium]|nr:autotransporter outer membrane beta-barrel domain-containing protein [Rickettsiales bacterium]